MIASIKGEFQTVNDIVTLNFDSTDFGPIGNVSRSSQKKAADPLKR